jgi:hypothetical protein
MNEYRIRKKVQKMSGVNTQDQDGKQQIKRDVMQEEE